MKKLFLLVLLSFFLLPLMADYSFSELKILAESGSASAQNNLGASYYLGEGVAQDYQQAAYWFTKAAEQGNVKAQYNLGLCYYKGNGVAQDYQQAAYWFTKAAEQGDVDAKQKLQKLEEKTLSQQTFSSSSSPSVATSEEATNNHDKCSHIDLGNGSYSDIMYHPDGGITTTVYHACSLCKGSTICPMCQGAGGKWIYYYSIPPQYIPCTSCNMTGICAFCHGQGGTIMTSYTPPGQTNNNLASHGSTDITSTPTNSNTSEHHHSTDSRYGWKTCHICFGTGHCNNCNGTGLKYNIYTGLKEDCSLCDHGECTKCNGTGKVYGLLY